MQGFGIYAHLAYIAMFSILPIFFFPVPILALSAGIFFGVFYGTVYTLIGATINSILMFYLSRFLGRDFIYRLLDKKASNKIKQNFFSENQKTLATIFFILRLIPLISYNLINYVSGITRIKISIYLATTVIGILPGTIVFLNTGDKSLDFTSIDFIISLILLFALIIGSSFLLKIYLKRSSNGNDNSSDL